ncbi:MAG TPA: hypothetical protein VKA68_09065 [bacterium]|nr:hypothetical protein [bacterium]
MRKLLILLSGAALLWIGACYIDNPTQTNFPMWPVQLDVPLYKQHMGFSDILDDSLITQVVDTDGDSLYAIQKDIQIDTTRLDNQLAFDNLTQSFTQSIDAVTIESTPKSAHAEIGKVALADIGPITTTEFIFEQIMPAALVDPLRTAIQINGGTATVDSIPSTDLEPVTKAFSFGDFEGATFESGTIEVTVYNNMVIPFGKPFTLSLMDTIANSVQETVSFSEYIPENSSATETIDLAGKTLSNINGVRVNGESDGSQEQPVTLTDADLQSGFSLEANVRNMVVSAATAKIPSQMIANTDTVALQNSDAKIESAEISTGSLDIDVQNTIDLNSEVTLSIPSLVDNQNNPLETTIQLTAQTDNQTSIDLSPYTLNMDTAAQQLEYSYEILTAATDPNLATIQENDSIDVQINLQNITFSSITGYFTSNAIVETDSIALQTGHQIQEALLDSGQLAITITNNMGVMADVFLSIDELYEPDQSSFAETISLPPLGAQQSSVFNLRNHTIEIDGQQQSLHYESRINLDPEQRMTINFDDSLGIDLGLTDINFAHITGIVEPITIKIDTVEQEISTLPEELDGIDLQDVDMSLNFETNLQIPVFLDLSISAYNNQGESDSIVVNDWDITQQSTLVIDQAEDLINLHPTKFVAAGAARIGDGVQSATVSKGEYAAGTLNILAPLSFQISEDISQEIDPQEVSADIPEQVEEFILYTDIVNQFLFGATVEVVAAPDTNTFHSGSSIKPDTLVILRIDPGDPDNAVSKVDSVVLNDSKIALFQEPIYLKTNVSVIGQSNGLATKVRSTDSLFISLSGSVKYLNDHLASENE